MSIQNVGWSIPLNRCTISPMNIYQLNEKKSLQSQYLVLTQLLSFLKGVLPSNLCPFHNPCCV